MVCLGNICRSPLAEGIMAEKLKSINKPFFIDSAGTGGWHAGEPPDHRSIDVAEKYGIDISNQRARKITFNDLESFDYIFTMDEEVQKDVIGLTENTTQKSKIFLMLSFAGFKGNVIVPDPYWGGKEEFEATYKLLDKACDQIIARFITAET